MSRCTAISPVTKSRCVKEQHPFSSSVHTADGGSAWMDDTIEPPCHDDVLPGDSLPRASLPVEGAARKEIPLARGLLDYFPAALAAVAALSKKGNDQHNPGEPMHHARGKSTDHADCVLRHLVDRGTVDTDGIRHSAKVAWRALALLQEELEREEGAPFPRGAKK